MKEHTPKEQILIRITGKDRPGLDAEVMNILADYDTKIQDIGQACIHATLSMGILVRIDSAHSGHMMKDLIFKASEMHFRWSKHIFRRSEVYFAHPFCT
jgi:phosphoserine phosphatase